MFGKSLDGILSTFNKALVSLDKFVAEGEKKVGVINAKVDVAQQKAASVAAEVEKAKAAAKNIKDIIGG